MSDFTGKNRPMPFDESQLNKSVVQASNTDSLPASEKNSDNKHTSDDNDDSLEESLFDSEYLKKKEDTEKNTF